MRHARVLVGGLLLVLLGACGGSGETGAPAEPVQPATTGGAGSTGVPTEVGERLFTAWWGHDGEQEAFGAWLDGAYGDPGLQGGASKAEQREAFTTWFAQPAHRALVQRGWYREARRDAQTLLRTALAATKSYAASHANTFDGLSIRPMKRLEPDLRYGVGPGRIGVVTLRAITPASIVLTTRTPDGEAICISLNNGGDVGYGSVDAATYADCVETSW